jgi:AcrR family transcriptional regulator
MSFAQRREQLLDVTLDMVSEQGFPAVSMRSVARRAEISRPIVYEHFGDLAGLLTAVVEREMARALAQISETELTDLSEGSARELMIESLATYLGAVHDHPTTWRLVLMPPEGAPELLRKSIGYGRAAVLASLTRAVRPALMRDREALDAELTARVLSAVADEYARLVLTDPARFPPERLLAHARWCVDQVLLAPVETAVRRPG